MSKLRQLIRSVNRRNIREFFSMLERDGIRSTMSNVKGYLSRPANDQSVMKCIELTDDFIHMGLPHSDSPLVSIVIPVYNHYKETYNCVKSIIEHTDSIEYEVIIGDDCSSDRTKDITDDFSNIIVNRNATNLGFTLNCNAASKRARGEYILFLNNDTVVTDNWLNSLVTLIESDNNIGMVGSKLVYPNGRLQEAGGILWSDGSAWNYGNNQDPTLPQFNYVKETDYISGASIMIRRSLFEEIGRFDERYAPAYCEDSDLAFEVRKHGFKVVYQPKSLVYHFEGVSNGKDLTKGMKAYQVTNLSKFLDKWKDILENEHKPNAVDVYHARDRTFGMKTIIVADNCLPEYDKDAGSRTIYQYIQLFKRMGLTVKFLCYNFYPLQPYTDILQQMGVEVLAGPWFLNNWKTWVDENADNIDYVFINRPHVAELFLPFFKEHTSAKIIYNLCDLHFLREMREYELTGDKKLLKRSNESKEKELKIIKDAYVSLTLSTYERDVLREYVPPEKIKIAPIFIYDDFTVHRHGETDGIMFVGGFGHAPNIDAVKWFCNDVFPLIKEKLPDIKFYICGSKPTEDILNLASDDIIVTGYLTDEELLEMYRNRRVCVIPLRYGAGVKGKTIEAMYNSIPIVTTSTGIEGLPDIESYLKPFDSAEGFAEEVIRVYNSDCTGVINSYMKYIEDNYSLKKAERMFHEIIEVD